MKNGAKASGAKVKGDKANVAKQHATHPTAAKMTGGRESDELASNVTTSGRTQRHTKPLFLQSVD